MIKRIGESRKWKVDKSWGSVRGGGSGFCARTPHKEMGHIEERGENKRESFDY